MSYFDEVRIPGFKPVKNGALYVLNDPRMFGDMGAFLDSSRTYVLALSQANPPTKSELEKYVFGLMEGRDILPAYEPDPRIFLNRLKINVLLASLKRLECKDKLIDENTGCIDCLEESISTNHRTEDKKTKHVYALTGTIPISPSDFRKIIDPIALFDKVFYDFLLAWGNVGEERVALDFAYRDGQLVQQPGITHEGVFRYFGRSPELFSMAWSKFDHEAKIIANKLKISVGYEPWICQLPDNSTIQLQKAAIVTLGRISSRRKSNLHSTIDDTFKIEDKVEASLSHAFPFPDI